MFLSFVVYNWESSRIESKFESLEEATDIPLFSRFHALRWTLMDRMSLLETTTVETPLVAWMYQSSAFCMNSTEMIPIDHWKFWVQAAAMGGTRETPIIAVMARFWKYMKREMELEAMCAEVAL